MSDIRDCGSISAGIEGPDGYVTGLGINPGELARAKALIESQWLAHLQRQAPAVAVDLAAIGIDRYHQLADRIDHAALWPKRARILPASAAAQVRAMSLFRRIEDELGPFEISDEDGIGWQEIYWRIVRPQEPADVGPLHADAWFWELGHGTTEVDRARIKVWIAIATEPGRNGLRVVAGSHRRSWRYHGEQRGGMTKPSLDEREEELDVQLLATNPGEAVLFHDRLLHGGATNRGTTTRVSLELTLFVRDRTRMR